MNNTTFDFQRELIGWTVRGLVSAAISLWYAAMLGFLHPVEIFGMGLGILFWVAVFTLTTVKLMALIVNPGWGRYARALKTAVWIKFLLTLIGFPAIYAMATGSLQRGLGVILSFDVFLGMLALAITGKLGGFAEPGQIAHADSLGWTMLTTIVEGALMAVVLALIALAVLGWRHWRSTAVTKPKLSPARTEG